MPLCNVKDRTASRRRFMLVVDSEEHSRSFTAGLLGRFQYTVCTAQSGQEALEMASVVTPALVVLAQRLEDMRALDLLRMLKQSKSARSAPVIVLCSEIDPVDERACLSAGAVVCLPSSFAIEDLYRVVQMAIEPVPRMNLRIPTELQVIIQDQGVGCDERGCAQDLSEQGVYMRTTRSYPLRTRLLLQIHLADNDLAVEAEVVYTRDAGDGGRHPGIGLQFVQISRQDQMRIRKYIRNEITKGIRQPQQLANRMPALAPLVSAAENK
jgi:CheY-like chemotaxis protein/Tfp pilus assembly protein PilZ